jgi:hypothetical protein
MTVASCRGSGSKGTILTNICEPIVPLYLINNSAANAKVAHLSFESTGEKTNITTNSRVQIVLGGLFARRSMKFYAEEEGNNLKITNNFSRVLGHYAN